MGLTSLWSVSLGLAAVALWIMIGLIFVRMLVNRRDQKRLARRQMLIPLLLGDGNDDDLRALGRSGASQLGELSAELIQLVRGDERVRLVDTATRLGVAAELRRTLKRGAVRARITAAEMLTHFHDLETSHALEEALQDRHPDVRLAAALSLALSTRAPDARQLVDQLQLGTREQSMLMVALFQEIARTRPDEIRRLVEDDACPSPVKAAAIEALASSGDYTLVPAIVELALAADPHSEELPRYLRSLGTFQHPAAAPAIKQWLGAPNWWVRSAAAEAAGRIGLVEFAYKLLGLLDDPDWWVRFRAGEALARLGEPGRRLLGERSRCGTERAREAARLTLAEQAVPA